MILSACLMLDHLGEKERATRIRAAIAAVIQAGEVRSYDMLRLPGGPEVLSRGAASTTEITDAILRELSLGSS
jgi:3-isopropylmalate dehydrogenase